MYNKVHNGLNSANPSDSVYSRHDFPTLAALVNKAYEQSPYHQKIWSDIYDQATFSSWTDFVKLKGSDKAIFQLENIVVKNTDLAYYFFSGGSTGKPKIIPVTKREWRKRNEYRASCYRLIGITKFDSVWIALPFGPWAAGHSAQHAFHILESNVLPAGLSNDQNIMRYIWNQAKRMNINVIATTPSILKFIESSIGKGNFFPIEKVITTGEYISDELKSYYIDKYGIEIFSSYGSSECFIGIECKHKCGYHFNPKEVLVEIVDPQTYLPTDSVGSVLLTNLTSEAIPLIRYKIGDRGLKHYEQCKCGSVWPRLEWMGRDNDFYEISGGVNFHSYQVIGALEKINSKVKKCDVFIKDSTAGKDLIEFIVYFDQKDIATSKQKKMLTMEATQAISTLSLDFNDVMFEQYGKVTIKVTGLDEDSLDQKTILKVHDLRKYRR